MEFSDNTLYYIAMIAIYSGFLPWLVARLTRSQADAREESRGSVSEVLALVERLRMARDLSEDPARKASFGVMIDRLLAEAGGHVAELNHVAATQVRDPSSRFMIVPRPRTPFAIFVTLIFIAAIYFGIMFLLTLGFDFINTEPAFDVIGNDVHRWRAIFLVGGAAGLFATGFIARFGAYRLYRSYARRMREEAVESAS